MSKTSEWVGRNLSLGGLVRHTGKAVGVAARVTINGAGAAAGYCVKEPETRAKIRNACAATGDTVDNAFSKGAAAVGNGVNTGIQAASRGAGKGGAFIAERCGASPENVALTENVCRVAGALVVGAVAGMGVADGLVALGAVAGTAGAAAATSGLAAVGGGSMAVGQVVVQGIAAAGAATGAASLADA